MVFGRGAAASVACRMAALTNEDRVVDIGCGPGTAVRTAARSVAAATGVDPDAVSLALARWISARRHAPNVTWLRGRAEDLPLPDGCATVAWSLSSAHHWQDRAAGLAEAYRVLAPGGRLLIVEKLIKPGARGHAAHGLSQHQAEQVAEELTAAGFTGVSRQASRRGRRDLVIIAAASPS
jgi:ubiquinone/menaquinone biosynthesis C-methylase UbiE